MSDQCGDQAREPIACAGDEPSSSPVLPNSTNTNQRAMLDAIVLAAYDVAVGLMSWGQLAASLAELLDRRAVVLFLLDERTGGAEVLGQSRTDDDGGLDGYLATARKMVGRYGDAQRRYATGEARRVAAGPVQGGAARWSSLSDLGAGDYVAGMQLANTGEELDLCIGIGEDGGERVSGAEMREQVDVVLPHFCRAAEIDRRLQAANARYHFSGAILDRLPFGLVQLDPTGAVIYANAEAHRMGRSREGLVIDPHGVRARTSAEDAVLQGAIRDALASRGRAYTRRLILKRGHGRRPCGLLLTTVSHPHGTEGDSSACVLFVTDPDSPSMIGPEAIADTFGLTAAEARVVARLAMGVSLPEIAAQLGVSINTARTLLARAMGKTGTNSQIALVRMVLTTLSPVGDDRR
jgi:DNA-binding CsgD family transcriptional regulator